MSDTPQPKSVSRFEASLLRILRFILKQAPAEQAMRLVHDRFERPKCLSATAVELVQDSLAKGTVLYLVRAGAWKRDRFLRGGDARFGRLWERSPVAELTLEFSEQTLEFLIWLTSVRPREEKKFWSGDDESQTIADRLFFFLTYDALRADIELAAWMRMSATFADNALVRLAHANDFVGDSRRPAPAFDVWLTEPGSFVLEAMQPVLEHRWLEIERTKGTVGDWTLLGQQGESQGQVLDAFTEAVNRAGRRDIVRFLLVVMSRVLATPDMSPTFWTGGLQGAGPSRLADRLTIQRYALSVLRNAERFRNWEQESRMSGYMDEDYAVSKFWLTEWERYDFATIAERAERVLQQLEPLRIA
jgi:hypothetical protein